MRKRIFEIVEFRHHRDALSVTYEAIMLIAITASIIPLMFIEETRLFRIIEIVTVSIFILDYLLRWLTADYRSKKGKMSFLLYPVTGWAIIDILSILPVFSLIGKSFKVLRLTRLMRVMRLFKFFR